MRDEAGEVVAGADFITNIEHLGLIAGLVLAALIAAQKSDLKFR